MDKEYKVRYLPLFKDDLEQAVLYISNVLKIRPVRKGCLMMLSGRSMNAVNIHWLLSYTTRSGSVNMNTIKSLSETFSCSMLS